MNTIKTIILTVVVTAIGYGAYLVITQEPPVAPEGASAEWTEPPLMDLGGASQGGGFSPLPTTTAPPAPATDAPPFSAAPATEAPPFGASEAPSFAPGAAAPAAPESTVGAALAPPPDWANQTVATAPPPTAAPQASAFGAPPAPEVAAAGGPVLATSAPAAPTETPLAAYPPPTDPAAPFGAPAATPDPMGVAAPAAPATTPVASAPGTPASTFTAMIGSVQAKLDAQQYVEAHRELSQWYERRDLSEAERRQLLDLLDALTGTVIYSRDFHSEPPYEVQPGDDLERIAQQYNVPWQFLQRINGVEDPRQLPPGQKLKVVRGPFRATVDLEAGQLTVWLDDRYAGRFPIGRGAPGATPEGEYQVQTKIENPAFYGADRTIEADDPSNPLGERWIELSEQVGIHGAADLNSAGHPDTAHCIRMSGSDVEDLYDILSVGSRITIRR